MERIGTLETICRYPVKSMAGEELPTAFVGFAGMMGDRAFAFERHPGAKGFPWHTGREEEDMVLFRPQYRDGPAATIPVAVEESFGTEPGVVQIYPGEAGFEIDVTTPEGRVLPVRSPELAAELKRRSGCPVTLRFSERSLYDCRPVSLLGNTSARGLGEELGMPLDRRRFRANFYADWTDDRPGREDDLVGSTLQLGDRLRIVVLERDPRCKMITIDPDTAETDPRVLRHVKSAHGGMVGVYGAVLTEGVIHKGDPISVA